VGALGRAESRMAGAGDERGVSALDFRPPPTIPLFNGKPWFLPAVYAWMTLQDRVAGWRRPR